MKKIFLTLVVLLPLSTYANEAMKLVGQYTYNKAEVAQVRDVELVPSMNTARYNELVKDKFQCFLRGDFFLCQKHLKNVELPWGLGKEIADAWSGRFFEFVPSALTPAITNESESLLEWDIFDTVKFEGFQVSEYHYYLLKGESDIHKIVMNFASGPKWMVVENESTLAMPIQKTMRTSQFKSRVFELSLIFHN